MFTPRAHQNKFADMFGTKKRVLNFDGCGTGKDDQNRRHRRCCHRLEEWEKTQW